MTKFKTLFTLFVLIFSSTFLVAQNKNQVFNFRGVPVGNAINVYWTIGAGNVCYDVTLEHSIDSFLFSPIFVLPGICGDSGFEENYNFTHPSPTNNARNYYRLNLGGGVVTDAIGIYFSADGNLDYRIVPHPVDYRSRIIISEAPTSEMYLQIYDLRGHLIHAEIVRPDFIQIPFDNLNNGVFVFWLSNLEDINVRGKFVKVE